MKDNRIEDFFNKSLESFNDAPTNAVWEGLANRLDEEQTPFYKSSIFMIGMLALLLLSFGGYAWYQMNSTIQQLKTDNQLLITKNENLSNKILTLKSENIEQQNALETCQRNYEIVSKQYEKKANSFIPVPVFNATNEVQASKDNEGLINETSDNESFVNGNSTKSDESINRKTNVADTEKTKTDAPTSTVENRIVYITKEEKNKPITTLRFSNVGGDYPKIMTNNKFPKTYEPSTFQYGLEIGAFAVKTDLFKGNGIRNQLNFGQSAQLSFSQKVFNRTKLTANAGYSRYQYRAAIDNSNRFNLYNLPGAVDNFEVVDAVNVKSELLDFALGFQYDFLQQGTYTPFIKSSAIWKVYMPQSFEYQLENGSIEQHNDYRTFAYFGAVDVSFGIEKMFKNGCTYQLELFTEQSLMPLGIEDVNLNNWGIKASILLDGNW